jgi:hypothetical protein
MTVRYEYKSACCGHEYIEQRAAEEPMYHPICNKCGTGQYELVNETVLAEHVEVLPALEIPVNPVI